jgi:hypothetical protein
MKFDRYRHRIIRAGYCIRTAWRIVSSSTRRNSLGSEPARFMLGARRTNFGGHSRPPT